MKQIWCRLAIVFLHTAVLADIKPLPQSQWPSSVAAAVPLILNKMRPIQKSIVSDTSKDSLFLLQAEWGEDIEQLLGLDKGNTALIEAACGHSCTVEQATLLLMEAVWGALRQ